MADVILNLVSLKSKVDAAGCATTATNNTPSLCPNKSSIYGYVTGGSTVVSIGGSYSNDLLVAAKDVTVAKVAGYISTAPTNTGYTYNGQNRALATAGGGSGTMYYKLDNGSWSTSIPTATGAGSWTLYYYCAATSTHTLTSTYSITVSVAKADLAAPSVSGATTTYNTAATASASGGGGQGSIEWESALSQTSVGSHTTRARWTGNSNYNASPWSSLVTVTMNKADLAAPTAYGATTTYSTTATATASGGGGLGSIEWSNGNKLTSVGSRSTKARWTGNGNYNASPWSNAVTITMNKANLSAPTAYGSTVAYGNTAYASASGGGGQGSIEWSNGSSLSGNAGSSKTTYARWSGNGNYNASGWSNGVTLSIVKANQSAPSASGSSVTLGSTAYASASGGGGQGYIEWSNGSSRSALGSQTTYARWSGNGNYNASGWSNGVTLTVSEPTHNGYPYRDMGLSVKWATRNVGSSSPGAYGSYYKYNGSDYARSNWGGSWKTPSYSECNALVDNTNYGNTTQDGNPCLYITSKLTGYTIYIPFAGYASNEHIGSRFLVNTITPNGSYVFTMRGDNGPNFYMSFDYKYNGSIRPVV